MLLENGVGRFDQIEAAAQRKGLEAVVRVAELGRGICLAVPLFLRSLRQILFVGLCGLALLFLGFFDRAREDLGAVARL